MKRTGILILIIIMILSCLMGCGTALKEKSGFTDESRQSVPNEENSAISNTSFTADGESLSPIPISYEALEVDYTGKAPIYDICNCRDKIYFTCEQGAYTGIYEMTIGESASKVVLTELPEGLAPMVITTDAVGDIYTVLRSKDINGNIKQMLLWKLDGEGNTLLECDITELVPVQSSPWSIAVDAEGYIFVRIGIMREELFLVFDGVGSYVGAIANEKEYSHIDALGRAQDGSVYAVLWKQDGTNVLAKCDGASLTLEEYSLSTEFSGSMFATVGMGFDSELTLYGPGYGICKYSADGEESVYLKPKDFPCAVDGTKTCILEDGRLLMVVSTISVVDNNIVNVAEGTKLYYIPLLKEVNSTKEETKQKEQVTLAVFREDALLAQYVQEYNAAQSDYEVVIENQLILGEVTLQEAISNLLIKIASGKGPDIVSWGSFYTPAYVTNEAFLDLSEFVGTLSEETYAKNILEAFALDNGLYVLVPEFKVGTIALKDAELDEMSGWNVQALMDYYENREEGSILFPGETRLSVFGYLCSGSIGQFVDWSEGTCNFEQDSFLRMMEFSNGFSDTLQFDEDTSLKALFSEGRALLYPLTLSDVFGTCRVETMFGDNKVAYMGYPIEGQSGNVAEIAGYAFSINALSKHTEEALDFLTGTLETNFQEKLTALPVSRTLLQSYIEEAMTVEYRVNGDGVEEPVAKEQVHFEGEEPVYIYQISEENAADFWELIDSVELSSVIDRTVYGIILEEMDVYFSGEKNAWEVMGLIQNRVQLYMQEQY